VRDSRTIWQLPPVKSGPDVEERMNALRERLRALSGLDSQLLPVHLSKDFGPSAVDQEEELDAASGWAIRVWGFIGRPGLSRSTRQDQHLFVNRRPVENRGLNFALLEGYHTALMKGRYPVCSLFLEIDPGRVDVNIHPAKREVKFHNERAVRHFMAEAVRRALLDYHVPGPSTSSSSPTSPGAAVTPATIPSTPSSAAELPGLVSRKKPQNKPGSPFDTFPKEEWKAVTIPEKVTPQDQDLAPDSNVPADQPAPGPPSREAAEPALAPSAPMPDSQTAPLLQIPLRVVGVIGRLYVAMESDRGLVLMDQHAAHERILFEQMLHRLEQGQAASQRLLLPETVELPVRDAHFLKEQVQTLNRLGVGLSEFGDRTFLLDALPPFIKVPDARQFMLELVDELKAAGQAINTLRLGEQAIAKTVCRHAVKANDPLAEPELEKLLEELRHCNMPYTCPHGRPTLIEMNYRELEKRFGRLV